MTGIPDTESLQTVGLARVNEGGVVSIKYLRSKTANSTKTSNSVSSSEALTKTVK